MRYNHPTFRAADSRVRAAEGSRVTAKSFGNPILGYQVDQTPFPGAGPIVGLEREAMTTATLPLEFLFQRGPRVTRANADVRGAEADANAARQRLGVGAASAYYRAALAQIQSATTHELVGWLDTLVAYNQVRVNRGATAGGSRSEVELIASPRSFDAGRGTRGGALLRSVCVRRSIDSCPA